MVEHFKTPSDARLALEDAPLHRTTSGVQEAQTAVRELLRWCGEDPNREGLEETPRRFMKALAHYTEGYRTDTQALLKSFADGGEGYDSLVVVRGIPFYSLCEHHLAPFFGTADVGYLPSGRVVGLSKLARLVEAHARRLQVQERITQNVAHDLQRSALAPRAVGVVVRARHLCMEARGISKQGSETVTSHLTGELRTNAAMRAEFMGLTEGRL